MSTLQVSFKDFLEALMAGQPVVCDTQGGWYIQNRFKNFIYKFLNRDEARLVAIGNALVTAMNRVERVPVRFDGTEQEIDFSLYLRAADKVISMLRACGGKHAARVASSLARRQIGLFYRLEEVNGGFDPNPVEPAVLNKLKLMVSAWKKENPLMQDAGLTSQDLLRLQETSRYHSFVKLLFDDANVREAFMLWIGREAVDPAVFIQFPAVQERVTESLLDCRVGRMGGHDLKVQKIDGAKVVTLPIEGRDVNILDEQQPVRFRGNYWATIGEIFDCFKNKNARVGNFEYFAQGIVNWNVHKWAWWDADAESYRLPDLDRERWWEQLPVFEILSKEKASERYELPLDGVHWSVSASATRENLNLDFERTHAFFEIAIPFGDGRYAIYDFGKYATFYPTTLWENLSVMAHNLHATVSYPDDCSYATHREWAHQSFEMTPEQGVEVMEKIKADMLKGMEGNFVYQIESDNCARWVHDILAMVIGEARLPDMFRIHLLDSTPGGITAPIFRMINMLPRSLATIVMTNLHRLFGAHRGQWIFDQGQRIFKSLTNHEFWETGVVYLPSRLVMLRKEGVLRPHRIERNWTAFKSHARTFVDHLFAAFRRWAPVKVLLPVEHRHTDSIVSLLALQETVLATASRR